MAYPIVVNFLKDNQSGQSLVPEGMVVHDTDDAGATDQAEQSYFSNNQISASAHAFIDWDSITQTLDWHTVGWHAGSTANHKFLGVELCVPPSHDVGKFNEVWARGVWLFAYCFVNVIKVHTITTSNLMSHAETSAKWHETDHTDPVAYFKEYGRTVDQFRAAVQVAINTMVTPAPTPTPVPVSTDLYRIRKSWADSASQVGAYSVLDNAKVVDNTMPGFFVYDWNGIQVYPAPIPAPVLTPYRIRKTWADDKSQVGAFNVLESAKTCANSNPGYSVFDNTGKSLYTSPIPTPAPVLTPYRIRKSWTDDKTQVGAFNDLVNAKACADSNPGYTVFDNTGATIYKSAALVVTPAPIAPVVTPTPVAPVAPIIVPTPVAVPVAPVIPELFKTAIMGTPVATAAQIYEYINSINPSPSITGHLQDLITMFLEEGIAEGVRGDIAICQSINETNWFRFGGQVLPTQNNFAGIGAVNNSTVGKGAWFTDMREGVRAQIQHLKCYASTEALKNVCVDPRFSLVARGIAPTWIDLAGKWAYPGYPSTYTSYDAAFAANETYGQLILLLFDGVTKCTLATMPAIPIIAPVIIPEPIVTPVVPVVTPVVPVVTPADPVTPVIVPDPVAPVISETTLNQNFIIGIIKTIIAFFTNLLKKS